MAQLVPALVANLTNLTHVDGSGALVPPPVPAETASKGLRKLCGSTTSAEASPEQAEIGKAALAVLREDDAASSVLCAAIRVATSAIDAIDKRPDADVAEAGLLRWGHLRVNALQVLLHLASSEAGCAQLLERTSDGAATACVALLLSNASRSDMEGVRTAANILRNLSMPTGSRPRLGALADIYEALLKHVAHRDPNTGAVAGAALRILVEGCPANAVRAARAAAPEAASSGGGGGGGGGGDGSDGDGGGGGARGGEADADVDGFAPVLAADITKMHPFCRVELARFLCATIALGAGGTTASQQRRLTSVAVLQFALFLLASKQAPLHLEACTALKAARLLRRGQPVVRRPAWPVAVLTVPSPDGERPLPQVLQALVDAGTISAEDCALLTAADDVDRK